MATKEQTKTKYLIQAATGDVYPYSDFLVARGDMHPYDHKLYGAPVNGRSPVLDGQGKEDEKKAEKASPKKGE